MTQESIYTHTVFVLIDVSALPSLQRLLYQSKVHANEKKKATTPSVPVFRVFCAFRISFARVRPDTRLCVWVSTLSSGHVKGARAAPGQMCFVAVGTRGRHLLFSGSKGSALTRVCSSIVGKRPRERNMGFTLTIRFFFRGHASSDGAPRVHTRSLSSSATSVARQYDGSLGIDSGNNQCGTNVVPSCARPDKASRRDRVRFLFCAAKRLLARCRPRIFLCSDTGRQWVGIL